ncbi:hypothetical protein P775_13745 [Puniceibacterium antarcticum]|uniref:CheW-like domain-containing protein n=1 Tax=Puniceibacterium antarcticum TaxID=1206336 RepID=A0A2G8RDH9_9RHOB|nr:chemotaxis protein CheW [Puniceibacterium antarcticum]PIL19582.1 hypothetical protein P775_13745 [Puniceibacterium antarcticum]
MSERSQYVTLGAAGELFAAPVESVQEILEARAIMRLPRSPENMLGMIDVRGQGIPVLDLRRTLNMPKGEDDESTRIIVLLVGRSEKKRILGLKTDRVYEVTFFDTEELEPAPEGAQDWQQNVIAGIGRRNGAFVTVLNLENLFEAMHPHVADKDMVTNSVVKYAQHAGII